jgi:hypothetical protein
LQAAGSRKSIFDAINLRLWGSGGTPALNNLSLKPTYPFADTSYRDRNSKSQSDGGRNCEDPKQGTSKEKETKTGFRK